MRRLGLALAVAAAAVGTSGCHTWAADTAPTPDGQAMYVVGRRANPAEVWVCPKLKTGDDCQRIEVILRD